jgi:hypothetical protein
MDQFCAACTSLPITQTTTMIREEKAKMASQLLLDGDAKASSENPKTAASIRMESSSAIVNANDKVSGQGPETQIPSHPLEGHMTQGSQMQRTMDQNQHISNSNLNEQQQQQQQQQQQFQQQQQHRWPNDLAGEPLSRRHSVDGSPRDRDYTSPQVNERSGFGGQGPGSVPSDVSGKDGNNWGDGGHNNTQGMNESGRNQNQNQNQSMNQSNSNQAQRPSMASSLLAEGISRMMDFLSKSPSQKSSMINPDRSPSTSSKNQNQNSSQVPSPYGMRNRASSYSDAENRSRPSQPQGNGFEGLDSSRQIFLNQNQNQNSGHISGSSQTNNQMNNQSQRRNGIYQNQNNVSNEEQRRARMSSVFEEKEIPKGMRLSGSDDGFVLVEPTPLPAPPHPWRGTVSFNTTAKNNHSTSGKINSANARDTGINGAGTTQSVTDGAAVREQYESSSQKNQQNQNQNQNQNQRTEQFQPSQQQQQQASPTQYLQQQEQDHRQGQGQALGQGQTLGLCQSSFSNHHQNPHQLQQQQPSPQDQHLRLSSLKEKSPSPSAIENEKFIIAELTQRTEFVCQVVLSIVSVGDGMAKEILQQEKKNQNSFAGKILRACDINYLRIDILCLFSLHSLHLRLATLPIMNVLTDRSAD